MQIFVYKDWAFYSKGFIECKISNWFWNCLWQDSPFNLAIVAHWDGFQHVSTIQKHCWTMKVVILNGGKRLLLNPNTRKPPPLLLSQCLLYYCPSYCKGFFLSIIDIFEPVWADLRDSFPVKLDYPFPPFMSYPRNEPIIVQVLHMCWTGDGPAQSKVGDTLTMVVDMIFYIQRVSYQLQAIRGRWCIVNIENKQNFHYVKETRKTWISMVSAWERQPLKIKDVSIRDKATFHTIHTCGHCLIFMDSTFHWIYGTSSWPYAFIGSWGV